MLYRKKPVVIEAEQFIFSSDSVSNVMNLYYYEPCIVMFTAKAKHQPGWLASQEDILAEDWMTL